MSAIITAIGNIITGCVSWIGTFCQTIVGYTPASEGVSASYSPNIITLFVLLPIVGLGIGLLKRLIKV